MYILGRCIDFIPHRGSINGTDPNKTAIRIAQVPVRKVTAEKIQAMENATNANSLLTEHYLNKTMKALEEKLDEKFYTFSTTITTHTDWSLEATTATLTHHTSNLRIQGLVNGFSAAAPELLQRPAPPLIPQGFTAATSPLPLQAPPASTTTHQRITKDLTLLMNSCHFGHHKWFIFLIYCIVFTLCNKELTNLMGGLPPQKFTYITSLTNPSIYTLILTLSLLKLSQHTNSIILHTTIHSLTYTLHIHHIHHNTNYNTPYHNHSQLRNIYLTIHHSLLTQPPPLQTSLYKHKSIGPIYHTHTHTLRSPKTNLYNVTHGTTLHSSSQTDSSIYNNDYCHPYPRIFVKITHKANIS